ncbi:hypothetical protein NQ176_g7124 [Zarea fungicola]|uniref:Uncharacterized protein n=1 Tax=Zarea fungicola TaxID=93591 RepID=A0ACC1MZM8_9HYPO|nr:hypothetical protein NQ176_g7124 [Lecanicillium fungicola]
MGGARAGFAVTLSIFFVQNTDSSPDEAEILLAQPINTTSAIAARDMWDSLSALGIDVKQLKAVASGLARESNLTDDSKKENGTAIDRLCALGEEQLVKVTSQHSELQALHGEVCELTREVEALRAEKKQLEDENADILSLISQRKQEGSLWGVRDADQEQNTLMPLLSDDESSTSSGEDSPTPG